MLGNWSFGNYFQEEAISWAFELLVDVRYWRPILFRACTHCQVYGLDKKRMYATYFEGDETLNLPPDTRAKELWMKFLDEDQILPYGLGCLKTFL